MKWRCSGRRADLMQGRRSLFPREFDLAVPHAHDTRRLEVVADGLPLFGGTQLAIDTTLVSSCTAMPLQLSSQPDAKSSALIPS